MDETCAQFFDGLGGHWLTRCCLVEDVACLPDQCASECDALLCVPYEFEPGFCVCQNIDCDPADPRAYRCCCP